MTEVETGRLRSFVVPGLDTLLILNSLHPFYQYNYSIAANTTALGPAAYTVIQTLQEGIKESVDSISRDEKECSYKTEHNSNFV